MYHNLSFKEQEFCAFVPVLAMGLPWIHAAGDSIGILLQLQTDAKQMEEVSCCIIYLLIIPIFDNANKLFGQTLNLVLVQQGPGSRLQRIPEGGSRQQHCRKPRKQGGQEK
jgi:hypothetical protein